MMLLCAIRLELVGSSTFPVSQHLMKAVLEFQEPKLLLDLIIKYHLQPFSIFIYSLV